MNIEVIALCDAATENQGKLNMLGAFDCIWTAKVPVTHPACAVVLRIRFSRIEEGDHPIRIDVVDEDGKSIVPTLNGNINVKFRNEDEASVANLIINLQGLVLSKYGGYSIDVAVNSRHETSLPFFVRDPQKPAVPPALPAA